MVQQLGNYFLLFKDSLVSSLIISIHKAFIFKAMLCFKHNYNIMFVSLFSVLGLSLGGIANYYLGGMMAFIRKSYKKLEGEYAVTGAQNALLVCCVALLSWIPTLGGMIQVLSGWFKLDLRLFVFLTTMSNLFYLIFLVFTTAFNFN